jgi:type II secretory ATPase GspE/PulE/Tfp pilus assembly ATPase PilB-like protein
VLLLNFRNAALTAAMHAEGVQPMWEAGIARALAGDTTFDEVVRVIAQPESRAAE